jgi:hypothetical protein
MKLYAEIQRGASIVRERKQKLRLLLNAFDFQVFFQHALDHFCRDLHSPFDFVQASLSENRLTSTFSQSTLSVAAAMIGLPAKPKASAIFERLSNLVASCIMLDAVRHNIRGGRSLMFSGLRAEFV